MRKLLIVLAFAGVSVTSMAQDVPTEKYSVATNSFWSNWFIQVGANWNAWYAGNGAEHGSNLPASPFKGFRSNPGAALSIGKWFTPGMGLRLKVQGIWGKTVRAGYEEGVNAYEDYAKGNKYWILNGHAMFNLSNIFFGYNEKRVFNLIPFVGGGFGRTMTHNFYAMDLSAGLQAQFRIKKHFAIHAELGWNRLETDIDGGYDYYGNRGWDSHTNNLYAELGLTFNLGKATWDKVPNVDALNADWQNRLDALNSQLRDANADNDRLRKMLAEKPAAEPAKTVKEFVATPVSVFFVLDKTDYLQPKDLVDVKTVADYAIEHNRKIRVFGYADSATGSVARNKWLGEHRAAKVANELVKLGVPRENIIEEPQGGVSLLTPNYERSYDRRVLVQVVE